MTKIFDDVWKIIVYSLISLTIVINLLHYLKNNDWWRIEETKGLEKMPNRSLVFYFVKDDSDDDREEPKAEIFVKNVSQEELNGFRGFFQKIFPGQYFFVRLKYRDKIAYSPVFILRDREVRRINFQFNKENKTLKFAGATSRKIKIKTKSTYERPLWVPLKEIISLKKSMVNDNFND